MQNIYEIISAEFSATATAAMEGRLVHALTHHDEASKAIQHELRSLRAWEKTYVSMQHEKELTTTRRMIVLLVGTAQELALLRSLIDTLALLQSVQTIRHTNVVGQA